MDQKNSIDKLHENLISIEATWREREKKTSVRTMEKRARQVQDKKCYAISSTALISTLAINRLIKRREKGGARSLHPSYYSSFHLLFSPMITLTRYQDRCVHDKAVQLVSFAKCSSFFPSWTLVDVHHWIGSRICHALASCSVFVRMESSIWKERRY